MKITVAAMMLTMSGCNDEEADVTVSCGNLSQFESGLGTLNTPQFALGNVILLNKQSKTSQYAMTLSIADNEKQTTTPVKESTESFQSEMSFSFGANVKSKDVEASIESLIKKDTELTVDNHKRTNIENVPATANKSSDLVKTVKSLDGNGQAILITGVVPADRVWLRLKNSDAATGDVQVIKFGNLKLNVTYRCNGDLKRVSTQADAFFKFTALKYDSKSNELQIDSSFTDTLKGYNLVPSIM
jgi:hypothetical protein